MPPAQLRLPRPAPVRRPRNVAQPLIEDPPRSGHPSGRSAITSRAMIARRRRSRSRSAAACIFGWASTHGPTARACRLRAGASRAPRRPHARCGIAARRASARRQRSTAGVIGGVEQVSRPEPQPQADAFGIVVLAGQCRLAPDRGVHELPPVVGTVVLWRLRFLPMRSMRVLVISLAVRCGLTMIGSTAG